MGGGRCRYTLKLTLGQKKTKDGVAENETRLKQQVHTEYIEETALEAP